MFIIDAIAVCLKNRDNIDRKKIVFFFSNIIPNPIK